MDISIARTFLEVVKTGSFVRAAASLNLTQTAVSARIRVLEELLERQIFIRNKAGARLTPAGEQFLPFATTLVQLWAHARHAVALPPGRNRILSIGVELNLWEPLLPHFLLWMQTARPDIAVAARVETADMLAAQVMEGTLDIAILYAAVGHAGLVTELLFEEKLVLAHTPGAAAVPGGPDHVHVDWGEAFTTSYRAAFPDCARAAIRVNHGPLALAHILAVGGSGYFREGHIRPLAAAGRLVIAADQPVFSHSAHMVYSAQADASVIDHVRPGLRAAANPPPADTVRQGAPQPERCMT